MSTITADRSIEIRLTNILNGTNYEQEVLDDMLLYLSEDLHPESLDLLYLRAAVTMAEYLANPLWREDHEAWYYHAPQIVAGEYPLEKLPEGAVRNLAKELYYGGKK